MVKKGRLVIFFTIVLVIGAIISFTYDDVAKNIKLGLDLQGGFEVLYEVEPPKGEKITEETLNSTVSALRNRIDVLGVSEPNIQIEGDNRIRVQLAGVEDQNEAREMLSTQAELTFRDVDDNLMLSGADLESNGASLAFDNRNRPIVSLKLKDAEKFGEVTREILNKPPGENLLVIWLDYEEGDSFREEIQKENPKFLSAPSVDRVLNTKDVVIEGNFTVEEATNLANLLNAGSLPVKLNEIYSTSVGAQFGLKAMEKTIIAGAIAIALIYLYMIAYYRFPGVIAAITLSIYIFLILVIFEMIDAVLTLPGIAALVLGVGMAVDANILTYERIKEEIKNGRSVLSAFKLGGKRAFTTILDANITTLIAAGVMFVYGTSSVKGFAVMLIISILVSFLTAVYGSRILLELWVKSKFLDKKPGWFGVKRSEIANLSKGEEREVNIWFDFVKHRNKFFIFSGIFLVVGIVSLSVFGLNLGTDFTSGSRVEITGEGPLHEEKIKEQFKRIGLEVDDLTFAGDNKERAVIQFNKVLTKQEIAKVKELEDEYGAEPNVSTVSPQVGRELAKNAFISVLIALIGIVIYIAVRFEWLQGWAAIASLVHDAFILVAVFSIFQIEVDITFIAAVLTIIGYSINDKIVTFDRIRENMKNREKTLQTFDEVAHLINKSLIQTFARSVNTVLTVLFAAAALAFFGSEAIRPFSIALLVGLLLGMYSSMFIAAQLWGVWKARQLKKKKQESPELQE